MEIEQEVKTFKIELICDNCHEKMIEKEDDNDLDIHTYYCKKCGSVAVSKKQYPHIVYRECK